MIGFDAEVLEIDSAFRAMAAEIDVTINNDADETRVPGTVRVRFPG